MAKRLSTKNKAIILAKEKGYHITKDGKVFSDSGKELKLMNLDRSNRPRLCFGIRFGKQSVKVAVHRYQAYMKFGNAVFRKNIVVRHLDDDPYNNTWDNLELGTQADNMNDIPKEKMREHGLNASKKRFTMDQVVGIFMDKENGMITYDLCQKYDTKKSTLANFFTGKVKYVNEILSEQQLLV